MEGVLRFQVFRRGNCPRFLHSSIIGCRLLGPPSCKLPFFSLHLVLAPPSPSLRTRCHPSSSSPYLLFALLLDSPSFVFLSSSSVCSSGRLPMLVFPFSLSSHLTPFFCKKCLFIMTSINPTSIPPITALRQELDYGDPQLSRCQTFYDSVRVFRKTFVSSQGWEGISIHDWRSREHQIALGEMVRSYLEQHGNGRLFWPDDKSSSRANRFNYSTDSVRYGNKIPSPVKYVLKLIIFKNQENHAAAFLALEHSAISQ